MVGVYDQFEGFGICRADCALDMFADLAQVEGDNQASAQFILIEKRRSDMDFIGCDEAFDLMQSPDPVNIPCSLSSRLAFVRKC